MRTKPQLEVLERRLPLSDAPLTIDDLSVITGVPTYNISGIDPPKPSGLLHIDPSISVGPYPLLGAGPMSPRLAPTPQIEPVEPGTGFTRPH